MSDQQASPEEAIVDTPDTGTDTQTSQEVDWQKRYTDLQPEYTRTSQELAELRRQQSDPEYRAQQFRELAAELGFEIEEGEDDTQFDDPLDQRLARLEQEREQERAERQQEQQLAALEQVVEHQLSELPQGLSEKQKDWIVSRAIALPATEQGVPNIKGAYEEFEALRQEDQQQWAKTKRAPHISPNGRAGTQARKLEDMSEQEILDWQVQRLADLSAE